jgi:hypothetical protein
MNNYGGKVVIKSCTFELFNTCGSVIRNKRAVLSKTYASTDYQSFYLERSNRYLYELLSAKFAIPATNPICATGINCYSIQITGTTFQNFGYFKSAINSPIAVNPLGGL